MQALVLKVNLVSAPACANAATLALTVSGVAPASRAHAITTASVTRWRQPAHVLQGSLEGPATLFVPPLGELDVAATVPATTHPLGTASVSVTWDGPLPRAPPSAPVGSLLHVVSTVPATTTALVPAMAILVALRAKGAYRAIAALVVILCASMARQSELIVCVMTTSQASTATFPALACQLEIAPTLIVSIAAVVTVKGPVCGTACSRSASG